MEKVTKYKVYCLTDLKWEYFYLEDDLVPTETCPIDGAHTVTAGSLAEVSVLEKGQFKQEEILPQGGKKVTNRGFQFDALANSETAHEWEVTENLYIKDGELEVKDGDFKDFAYMALIDKSYIHAGTLYPAEYAPGVPWSVALPDGVILHEYIKDYPVDSTSNPSKTYVSNKAITDLNTIGMHVLVKYHNHTMSTVRCKVRVNGYS